MSKKYRNDKKKIQDALDQERAELGEQFETGMFKISHVDPKPENEPWNTDGEPFDEDNQWNNGEAEPESD